MRAWVMAQMTVRSASRTNAVKLLQLRVFPVQTVASHSSFSVAVEES